MKPVNVGLIGHGVIGHAHLRAAMALTQKVNLVAAADLREEMRQEAVAAGCKSVYCSDVELLADPRIEAVILALPTGVRDAVATRALRAGKHVMIEKPPALNAAQVERFMAMRGNLTVACGSGRIAMPESVGVVSRFIAEGHLGPLRMVRIRATHGAGKKPQTAPPPWRESFPLNGGGILVNWGVYDLNYVLELTGWTLRPSLVMAQTWPLAEVFADRADPCSDADAYFIALIRCEGGEVISFERGEFMALHTEEQWQLIGPKASLTMSMHSGKDKTITLDQASHEEGVVSKVLWQGDDNCDQMKLCLEDFVDCIREGREPRTNLERALVIQKIFDAIYASARLGRAVEV